jgi:hypothetical protein
MGKQTGFHMLAEDCKQFLDFVQERDAVVVTHWRSESADIEAVRQPWKGGDWYCLWNQTLLPALEREYIPKSDRGPYYRVDSVWPVIEFSYPGPVQEPWNGRPALTQGRVWAGFERENKDFERWYNSVVRWIRKNFIKNPVPLGGYVGPAAYNWYKHGGLLLPAFRPPITPQWLSWVEAQDQHRTVFSK